MKGNYLKVLLLSLLVAGVVIQGCILYDVNNSDDEQKVSYKAKGPLIQSELGPFVSFFDRSEDPFAELERLRRKMENRFMRIEDYFQTIPSLKKAHSEIYRIPSFDMKERDGKYFIIMEVPGLDKKTINLKTQNGQLIVSAHVSKEKDDNTTTYYQRERRTSSYRHVISLPDDANEESLLSEYKDGLLTITFEKIVP